ncbi:hypothetical protein VP01_512g3 [Puccinia sorghi]|uniref:Uncharacterized protein n=1 Tax=Puccinia sorghi TaxID=27349 RepID=A0A0L6UL40_9BASI|nr:hypothetical protein VP01_512g3 [Puccinia sorghi]
MVSQYRYEGISVFLDTLYCARLFTTVPLRFYLNCHKRLVRRAGPGSYRQVELYKIYKKYLANQPQLDPEKFDWPGMYQFISLLDLCFMSPADLTIYALRHVLDKHDVTTGIALDVLASNYFHLVKSKPLVKSHPIVKNSPLCNPISTSVSPLSKPSKTTYPAPL